MQPPPNPTPRSRVRHGTAVAALRGTFSHRPLGVRAHVLGRYLSCPYLRTLHHVLPGARVLDVGAGHGVLAVLALEAGAHSVAALEPDLRKALPSIRRDGVRFVAGYADAIAGSFDLITLYDVLYRVPIADRDRLLVALRELLRPGGVLLIKEIDPERRVKFAWNRAQEFVSDRFLGITLGSGLHYEPSARLLARLAAAGLEDCAVEDVGAGYPHAHVVYTARVPSAGARPALPTPASAAPRSLPRT